jgi:flagellin-like hook-associated protein FlgL
MDHEELVQLWNRMGNTLDSVSGELYTLRDIAISLGSINNELQELNRNLYDMDKSLSGIKARIENLESN